MPTEATSAISDISFDGFEMKFPRYEDVSPCLLWEVLGCKSVLAVVLDSPVLTNVSILS